MVKGDFHILLDVLTGLNFFYQGTYNGSLCHFPKGVGGRF